MPMRILFLTENFPPEVNAAATRVYERAVHWVKWGHEVIVVTTAPNFPDGRLLEGYRNKWYQTETRDGIAVIRVKTFISPNKGFARRILDFVSFMLTGFVGALTVKQPDVVVATSPQFFTVVAGFASACIKRKPFIFELSDLWPSNVADLGIMKRNFAFRLIEKLESFLYRKSHAVVALTNAFKENLVARNVPAEKISVVINGVDTSRYSPRPRSHSLAVELGIGSRFVVGYIGTHGLAHALENVVRAAHILREHSNIVFLFVGSGATRDDVIAEAVRLGVPNVIFVPQRPKSEIPDYWSLCNLALIHLKNIPVYGTVIPSKMFEAMAMCLPLLLASPDGEAKAILQESATGLWVPAENPTALADAVLSFESDRKRLAEFASRCPGAAKRYSRERQALDFLKVIERVSSTVRGSVRLTAAGTAGSSETTSA